MARNERRRSVTPNESGARHGILRQAKVLGRSISEDPILSSGGLSIFPVVGTGDLPAPSGGPYV
jgi:hypothetical protein